MKTIIEKTLSPNDIGKTGGHQAGILIPKRKEILNFFPSLDEEAENPRVIIRFEDDLCQTWKFNYIYYNNRLRGGTRNEYRLTGMTAFLRSACANIGDILVFEKIEEDFYIHIKKSSAVSCEENGIVSLVLDNSWKIINI